MAKRISIKHKRREAPEWVFQWERPENPLLWKAFSLLVAGGGFALLLMTVRFRVSPPLAWAAPKAVALQVVDDDLGRALTQRAREGGPFPSRFEPAEWGGRAALETALLSAAIGPPPTYVPALRDLPDEGIPSLRLARRGEPEFPASRAAGPGVAALENLTEVPVLYPLAGIGHADIPRELPPLVAAVDASMTASAWRFLVRIDAAGHVTECVSLAGGDEAGVSALNAWLRRVSFPPTPAAPPRWIGLGVGFTNQPASHGTVAH